MVFSQHLYKLRNQIVLVSVMRKGSLFFDLLAAYTFEYASWLVAWKPLSLAPSRIVSGRSDVILT